MKNKLLALLLSLSVLSSAHASSTPAAAASRTLNVVVHTGTSEIGVYGTSYFSLRFPAISNKVATMYRAAFSINLNFSTATPVLTSVVDECKSVSPNYYHQYCRHGTDAQCNNNGTLHHTNMNIIRNDVFPRPHNSSNAAHVFLTPAKTCKVNDDGSHGRVLGRYYIADNVILVNDYDYMGVSVSDVTEYEYIYVSKTLAHEIGHAYGVDDHYDTEYNDTRDFCIWGAKKEDDDVASNLRICSTCRSTILANANLYNHS